MMYYEMMMTEKFVRLYFCNNNNNNYYYYIALKMAECQPKDVGENIMNKIHHKY